MRRPVLEAARRAAAVGFCALAPCLSCGAQGLVQELRSVPAQERCGRAPVEFIVGGGGVARAPACAVRHAVAPAQAPAHVPARQARPTAARALPDTAQQERRQILEMELNKERQQASLLRSREGQAAGLQAEQRSAQLHRREKNIAALQAEIGRLP